MPRKAAPRQECPCLISDRTRTLAAIHAHQGGVETATAVIHGLAPLHPRRDRCSIACRSPQRFAPRAVCSDPDPDSGRRAAASNEQGGGRMNLFRVQMIGSILYSVPASARRLPWIYNPSPALVMTDDENSDKRRSSPWRDRFVAAATKQPPPCQPRLSGMVACVEC